MRERLADALHEQWSKWMRYLFSKGTLEDDGTWTMPAWAVGRWRRQMSTPFAKLPEDEQDSDRRQADIFLAAFNWWDPTVLGPDTEIYVAKPSE